MENISKHISFSEATKSNTAIKKGISNIPNESQLQNMKLIAEKVFEPLRVWAGEPIRVNSMFRSYKLNKVIGGAGSSQHCSNNGSAIDIDALGNKTNADLFNYIKDNIEYDQLIWEFGNDTNPDWVHVSYKYKDNRGHIQYYLLCN